jgi:hypothetical protein
MSVSSLSVLLAWVLMWIISSFISTDPLDFDRECDASLPLENMLKPNPSVRKLFEDIDKKKARVWALTNAYRTVCLQQLFA